MFSALWCPEQDHLIYFIVPSICAVNRIESYIKHFFNILVKEI